MMITSSKFLPVTSSLGTDNLYKFHSTSQGLQSTSSTLWGGSEISACGAGLWTPCVYSCPSAGGIRRSFALSCLQLGVVPLAAS